LTQAQVSNEILISHFLKDFKGLSVYLNKQANILVWYLENEAKPHGLQIMEASHFRMKPQIMRNFSSKTGGKKCK
jgi:hypothetical protein